MTLKRQWVLKMFPGNQIICYTFVVSLLTVGLLNQHTGKGKDNCYTESAKYLFFLENA